MDARAHVLQLARDLDVQLWICETSDPEDEVDGVAQQDPRAVFVTHDPDHRMEAYMVALHELGHHASLVSWSKGPRLDHEVAAWEWAEEASLWAWYPEDWQLVLDRLKSFAADGRYKQTPRFQHYLKRVRREASPL